MATTTTFAAIRDNYRPLIEAATPSVLPEFRFRRCPARYRLQDWVSLTGSIALRQFEFVRDDTSDVGNPPFMDPSAIERNEDCMVMVAYPTDPAIYGRAEIDDLEMVMRTDARQLRDLIFSPGNYLPGHSASFVTIEAPDRSDPDTWYQPLRVSLIYTEAQSLT